MHIIIDGYNFIRQVPYLARHEKESLQAARDSLIGILARYKKKKAHKITVVFDGVINLSEFAPAYQEKGIYIRFSPDGLQADDIIKQMVLKEKQKALVVSSDREVSSFSSKQGGSVITSPDFFDKVQMAQLSEGIRDRDAMMPGDSVVNKRWQTQKKGPAKRLSKRDRKNRMKTDKL